MLNEGLRSGALRVRLGAFKGSFVRLVGCCIVSKSIGFQIPSGYGLFARLEYSRASCLRLCVCVYACKEGIILYMYMHGEAVVALCSNKITCHTYTISGLWLNYSSRCVIVSGLDLFQAAVDCALAIND